MSAGSRTTRLSATVAKDGAIATAGMAGVHALGGPRMSLGGAPGIHVQAHCKSLPRGFSGGFGASTSSSKGRVRNGALLGSLQARTRAFDRSARAAPLSGTFIVDSNLLHRRSRRRYAPPTHVYTGTRVGSSEGGRVTANMLVPVDISDPANSLHQLQRNAGRLEPARVPTSRLCLGIKLVGASGPLFSTGAGVRRIVPDPLLGSVELWTNPSTGCRVPENGQVHPESDRVKVSNNELLLRWESADIDKVS